MLLLGLKTVYCPELVLLCPLKVHVLSSEHAIILLFVADCVMSYLWLSGLSDRNLHKSVALQLNK